MRCFGFLSVSAFAVVAFARTDDPPVARAVSPDGRNEIRLFGE